MSDQARQGTYGIKELKLYHECCDQLLLSDEPNSAYIAILTTGGLNIRSMRLRGIVAEACFMLTAMLSGVQRWTQKVPDCDTSEISRFTYDILS